MWQFPWRKNRELEEIARRERGKLAKAISDNDVARYRLGRLVKDGSASGLLEDLFARLDGAERRD